MTYRNIDSILRERKTRVMIVGAGSGMVNMSRLPDNGEVVGVETDFSQYLTIEVHSSTNFGNTYHGAATDHIYKGPERDMELIIDQGELIEFSHSKIYAIHRG